MTSNLDRSTQRGSLGRLFWGRGRGPDILVVYVDCWHTNPTNPSSCSQTCLSTLQDIHPATMSSPARQSKTPEARSPAGKGKSPTPVSPAREKSPTPAPVPPVADESSEPVPLLAGAHWGQQVRFISCFLFFLSSVSTRRFAVQKIGRAAALSYPTCDAIVAFAADGRIPTVPYAQSSRTLLRRRCFRCPQPVG